MREADRREIDGLTFLIAPLPGRRATRAFHRLSKGILPAAAKAAGTATAARDGEGGLGVAAVAAGLSSGLDRLFADLPEAEFEALMDALFATVSVVHDGKSVAVSQVFDSIFAGKVSTVLKLMVACVEVSFGDFLPASLGALAAEAMATVTEKVASRLRGSPKTPGSAGPSGGSTV